MQNTLPRTCTNHLDPTSVSISRCSWYVFLCNKAMIRFLIICLINMVSIFQCFFPQNIINQVMTPLYILNSGSDSWQVHLLDLLSSFSCSLYMTHVSFFVSISTNLFFSSLQIGNSIAPPSADPSGSWHDCSFMFRCNAAQKKVLEGK